MNAAEFFSDPRTLPALQNIAREAVASLRPARYAKVSPQVQANRDAYARAMYAADQGPRPASSLVPPTKTPGRGNQAVGLPPSPPASTISDMQSEPWEQLDLDTLSNSPTIVARARLIAEAVKRDTATPKKSWHDCLLQARREIQDEAARNPAAIKARFAKAVNPRASFQLMAAARKIADRRLASGRPVSWDCAKDMALAGEV